MTTKRTPKTRPVPGWVQELVEQVCAERHRRPPLVTWWQRPGFWSSGYTNQGAGRVHVTAGTDPVDQRMVVLHELAHWLGRPSWNHNRCFWELCWQLYGQHFDAHLTHAWMREDATKARLYCPYPWLGTGQSRVAQRP